MTTGICAGCLDGTAAAAHGSGGLRRSGVQNGGDREQSE